MERIEYPGLDEAVYRQTLPNGLRVLVCPRQGFSRRIAYFVTDYGSMHTHFAYAGQEYRAPAGIAHYLEHKLFDMPDGRDISAEFAALGANVNAFTSYDMTAYYFSCTEHFPECLRLLLEFVSTPYFTAESVEKERGIIDQEIGMNEDAPDSRVYEDLMAMAYAQHPVRVPILGTSQTIRDITPEMLTLCHRAFYTPGNMILCVVGDVQPEAVCAAAREILGDTPRETGEKRTDYREPLLCPKAYTRRDMEVAMPMFSLLFKAHPVQRGEAGIRREIAADLAAEALFGEASQLYLDLYRQGIIDSSFGGGFETIDGCAMLMVSGDSRQPEQIRDALIAQAEKLVQSGIPEADFQRMKRSALGRRIRALDSFDATCLRLAAYALSDFAYFRFPEIYAHIQQEELLAFLAETVRRENCGLSVIYPISQEEFQ